MEKVIKALSEADKPLTTDEISKLTGIAIPRLRMGLFRLMGEGRVERKQKGKELVWALKVSTPSEERYEKLSKRYVP